MKYYKNPIYMHVACFNKTGELLITLYRFEHTNFKIFPRSYACVSFYIINTFLHAYRFVPNLNRNCAHLIYNQNH